MQMVSEQRHLFSRRSKQFLILYAVLILTLSLLVQVVSLWLGWS